MTHRPMPYMRRFFLICAVVLSAGLSACAHHGHGALPPAADAPYAGQLARASITFAIPIATGAIDKRPAYVSSATKSVIFTLNSASSMTAGEVSTYNATAGNTFNTGTLPSAACPLGSGVYTCTFAISLPPGTDNATLTTYDATSGAGNILSTQIQSFTVTGGVDNNIPFTLDANANTMTVTPQTSYCAAAAALTGGGTLTAVGTNPVTFAATYTDAQGKTIVGPGLPTLKINGSSTSGTVTGTGGNVAFSINQSTQTYTLAATTSATTASITVTAVPGNSAGGSDGLGFSKSLAYTFKSAGTEPASFLADTEQIYSVGGALAGGVVNLWTVSLGASDTITPFSTPQLTSQNNDINVPLDMTFDASGDLAIANGGSGGVDVGSFACIPATAIGGGAVSPTVITTNVKNPFAIALGADGSIALANQNSPTYLLSVFNLGATGYTADAGTRNLASATYSGYAAHPNIVAMPASTSYPSGTFAETLVSATTTRVVIKKPNGSTVELPQDSSVAFPALAYDPANDQFVLVGGNGGNFYDSHVTFWNASTLTKVKDFLLEEASGPDGVDGTHESTAQGAGAIATSPDGHVAAVIATAPGDVEVVVYDNTAARNRIANALDYSATNADGSIDVYGGTASGVDDILPFYVRWLSNTKLLVGLQSEAGNQANSFNGLYIYDITQTMPQTGYDLFGDPLPSPTIKQTAFKHVAYLPQAAAYKP